METRTLPYFCIPATLFLGTDSKLVTLDVFFVIFVSYINYEKFRWFLTSVKTFHRN